MPRKKLQRFAQLDKLENVIQCHQAKAPNKFKKLLKKNSEIILELGCGTGDYSLALAQQNPQAQIVGIDIQGERLWHGAIKAKDQSLKNILWLRIRIENLLDYLPKNSVSEIWLTFPDPYPKKRQSKKRLTAPNFLQIYKKILKANGQIHLKTDDNNLFYYSLDSIENNGGKVLKQISNIYRQSRPNKILRIQTNFEKKHLQAEKSIQYIKFSL